jgi:hypothetical protein
MCIRRLPSVYRRPILLDENRALLTLPTLAKFNDAHHVRDRLIDKMKKYGLEKKR